MSNRLTDLFGIEYPIFAFSHCRDVVAAVTNSGGMGVLGALAFSPEQLEMELQWIDEHVGGKPYGVDVVMPVKTVDRDAGLDDVSDIGAKLREYISQDHWDYVDKILADHGVDPSGDEEVLESGAGMGAGVLGALAFSPEQLEIELKWIDEHVGGKPYGVDVVMPVKTVDRDAGLDDVSDLGAKLR
ncbi:MAG: nitronate monooxygenase, partial [Acidimicrobiales bacterium]